MDMIEIAERLAATEHDVQALKDWQQQQNGSLQRLDDKMERLEDKMDGLQKWLIGLLGGVITSLILLIVNISLGR